MDDDDKFWSIPEGKSWKDAGPMLIRLGAKGKSERRAPRKRPAQSQATVEIPRTPEQWAEHHRKVAAFYRRIGREYDATLCERRAEAAMRKSVQG